MSRLGILTGMTVEASRIAAASRALAAEERPLIAAAGGDARKAERAARDFAEAGVAGLVSFGIAGGLDPSLAPGDIVLADAVWRPHGAATPTHSPWRHFIADAIGQACRIAVGSVAGSDAAVSSVAAKAALRGQSGAVAVDMESHGVAAAAAAAGLPLLVVRAIADPASRAIPAAALAGIGSDGRRRPFAVLARLITSPVEIPALIRLARDSGKALESLSAAAPAVLRETVF